MIENREDQMSLYALHKRVSSMQKDIDFLKSQQPAKVIRRPLTEGEQIDSISVVNNSL